MLFASVQRWIANLHKLASDEQLVLSSSTNARLEVETATTGSQSCCNALVQLLGDRRVVRPGSEAYESSVQSYFSLKNSETQPSCIVVARSSSEVSAAVRSLSRGRELGKDSCRFAIRSGGHTPFKGAASIDDGVLLDLRRLDAPGVSEDRRSIVVSPGWTWDQVTERLDPYNVSTLGARVASVGVGGAVLNCGTSFFSPRYGFICDMVDDFEVVLANGTILHANERDNKRLWKALRGGGNNFGVVTAITLRTFPQGRFWGGQVFHDISTRKEHFKAHAELASTHPYDPYVHYINNLILSKATKGWFIGSSLQYTKSDPPVVEPKVFEPFLAIKRAALFPGGPTNTLRIDNVTSVAREYAALATGPKRWLFATTSFAPSADMMEAFFQMADETFRPHLELAGFSVAMAYQPIPPCMATRRGEPDSLGPVQTEGSLIYVHLAVSLGESEGASDHVIESAVQGLVGRAQRKAREMGVYRSYVQATYADSWQNPLDRRSASTVEDLIAVSREYDPAGVFQYQVPGGFKLPRRASVGGS
ncbi:oxidoreductase [Pyricularia oryzae 70-15]|uniref:Oxidoreductase n=3 Tax=Pyricularia oryzae TaxID=318829 RepID=G4NCC0_PYRO7|nr:oxidoreductase [Pyricularia oryzae 70-15]EHA49069.1 oxidoreductase [Pyricularia oryzae 70-15]ELQ42612.1 oxidoreductase [Pyricularia oryzae Y34]KAI7916639.1 oxidoreductase [Pyricularia oryzae]KAI7929350.1 oxidoreductase [Pyricularia oryzae]